MKSKGENLYENYSSQQDLKLCCGKHFFYFRLFRGTNISYNFLYLFWEMNLSILQYGDMFYVIVVELNSI